MSGTKHILPIIVIAQFLCTSLWFAGNAITSQLIDAYQLSPAALGAITSAVQLGFIAGTLVYAAFTISDRFHPSVIFFLSALLGAIANSLIATEWVDYSHILSLRFLTGFFLAGIYPVGMKIASDYFEKGLGRALGFLVGALVLGTALPYGIASFKQIPDWRSVLYLTSGLALVGGMLMLLLVPKGPFHTKGSKLKIEALGIIFKNRKYRKAAFGYFGHMWELYAFWAFVPVILTRFANENYVHFNISQISFLIVGIGSLACVASGLLSQKYGEKKVAVWALQISGLCCVLSAYVFEASPALFLFFMSVWGISVIADSPLLSSLVARNAPAALKGTAITIATCIGFAITIVSIQLLSYVTLSQPESAYVLLAVGPFLGLIALRKF